MKRLLIAVGIATIALAVGVGTATAADLSGGAQGTGQLAGTLQGAPSTSQAGQQASNTGLPAGFSGSGLVTNPGSSSATQNAGNTATSDASNSSKTGQTANATQTGGSSSCKSGCGGGGQSQTIDQAAATKQDADAKSKADQNAVNADVPVSIAGGNVSGGSSSATQDATNAATADASNSSKTDQTANAAQTGGSSSCLSGCGGAGQAQTIDQSALTKQDADADAKAKQNAVNANVPVSIAGGSVSGGSSSANQTASNAADASANNNSKTNQTANATQTGGSSSCTSGCGGNGQEQNVVQDSKTKQEADADALAKQNAVNANVPVSIAGSDVVGGSSSATQTADNNATADASNRSKTDQTANATQTGGSSSCTSGCGGNGQEQNVIQASETKQNADADAKAKQNAVNANVPVSIAGGDVVGGSSSATQTANNNAVADASNSSKTDQTANATQTGGDSKCWSGCGGNGQEQNVIQASKTKQDANADSLAKQNAVNANTPVGIAGGDVIGGSSSATQTANNNANADANNYSKTNQDAEAAQTGGSSNCWSGCGGNGQEQNVIQFGLTKQNADADAKAKQDAVNANTPVSIAGGDVVGGSSSATQTANNGADANAANVSKTDQTANPTQQLGSSSCWSGCGGNGQEQNVAQVALTKQNADADAIAKQNALNANVPVSIAGGSVSGGSSSATQTANNNAVADANNYSKTKQDAVPQQIGGSGSCWSGCGGNSQEQNVFQLGLTKQDANADAWAKQDALNANTPVSISGKGPSSGGSSSATQTANNNADANGSNKSKTEQFADPIQQLDSSWCWSGCGGKGQEQNLAQIGLTKQQGNSDAWAKQHALNTDTPISQQAPYVRPYGKKEE
jgi:trimeric autotransporter adhesin